MEQEITTQLMCVCVCVCVCEREIEREREREQPTSYRHTRHVYTLTLRVVVYLLADNKRQRLTAVSL